MTWDEAIEQYLESIRSRRAPESLSNFQRIMKQFLTIVRVENPALLTAEHLRAYHLALTEKCQSTTVLMRFYYLFSFLRWAHHRHLLLADLTKSMELPKAPQTHRRILSPTEVLHLIDFPQKTLAGQRNRVIVEFLYGTGLRVSEAIGVNLEDIDLTKNQLLVRRGKGGKSRWCPFGTSVALALELYLTQLRPTLLRDRASNALWLTSAGRRFSKKAFEFNFHRLVVQAGMPWVNVHAMRHAYATHLLEGGADIRHIQALLGHATLSSTQIYTHLMPIELFKEYRRTHPRARRRNRLGKSDQSSPGRSDTSRTIASNSLDLREMAEGLRHQLQTARKNPG